MFLQEAVVKLLALDLPCLTQVVLARLLLHGQVEMMHWMQVLKLQFRHLLLPMPSDPDARREARSVTSTFRAQ